MKVSIELDGKVFKCLGREASQGILVGFGSERRNELKSGRVRMHDAVISAFSDLKVHRNHILFKCSF